MRDNDPAQMAELRRTTGLRVAAGQNEGQLFRFQALLDVLALMRTMSYLNSLLSIL